ncbi:MAG TPA: N-acetylneuraminate synthase family protein, partial [Vicinamibacterales bacterium]|nr:N-acetylneuraminate synthase family protein [Vicinamibacterales bacterium]
MRTLTFGDRVIGEGQPTYVVAEIGINHNGSLDLAKRLIDAAADARCDAVKFQKRTPELCVPAHERDQIRQTPWGTMSYLDYRLRMEFGVDDYAQLVKHCESRSIAWFTSCWDESA